MSDLPQPWSPIEDKPNTTRGYMCAIAWECECGEDANGTRIYPTIESLKYAHKCWEHCGIVEVEITSTRTVCKGIEEF